MESNEDLRQLFDVLRQYKDKNGLNPVFTAVTIVGNPNFEKIEQSCFKSYSFEPFNETLKKYPLHDQVYSLYLDGIRKRLFVPVFHGREHLNVQRWMKQLKLQNPSVLELFNYGITGVSNGMFSEELPDFQAAFDLDTPNDLLYMVNVLTEGLHLFNELFGYESKYFVPTNGPFNNSLERVLNQNGIIYINTGKKQLEPLGNNNYKTNIRFLG